MQDAPQLRRKSDANESQTTDVAIAIPNSRINTGSKDGPERRATSATPTLDYNYTVPINNTAYTSGYFAPRNVTISLPTPAVASFYGFGGNGSQTCNAAGCTMGGGNTRNEIYGGARYIKSDSLPFIFWPISWGSSGYGGTYRYNNDTARPGGEQSLFIASPKAMTENPDWVYYYILGDMETLKGVRSILQQHPAQGGCGMAQAGVYPFEPDQLGNWGTPTHIIQGLGRENVWIVPENVFQYYRGSSVALATPYYLNVAATSNNTYYPLTRPNTSFNETMRVHFNATSGIEFLNCLNVTIASSIPIPFPMPKAATTQSKRKGLSPQAITFMALGLVIVLALAGTLTCWDRKRKRRRGQERRRIVRVTQPSTGGRRVVVVDRTGNTAPAVGTRADVADDAERLPLYTLTRDQPESPPPYTPHALPS